MAWLTSPARPYRSCASKGAAHRESSLPKRRQFRWKLGHWELRGSLRGIVPKRQSLQVGTRENGKPATGASVRCSFVSLVYLPIASKGLREPTFSCREIFVP